MLPGRASGESGGESGEREGYVGKEQDAYRRGVEIFVVDEDIREEDRINQGVVREEGGEEVVVVVLGEVGAGGWRW